jgi:hypothetical protein
MRVFLLFIADLPCLAAFTTAVSLLPSLLSPKHPRAMAGYGDGAANNGFGRCSLHQWEARLLYTKEAGVEVEEAAEGVLIDTMHIFLRLLKET